MDYIEWAGAVLGVGGALLLSLNNRYSALAWPLWAVSNVLLIVFAFNVGAWGLMSMQGIFLVISLNGMLRWRWRSRPA